MVRTRWLKISMEVKFGPPLPMGHDLLVLQSWGRMCRQQGLRSVPLFIRSHLPWPRTPLSLHRGHPYTTWPSCWSLSVHLCPVCTLAGGELPNTQIPSKSAAAHPASVSFLLPLVPSAEDAWESWVSVTPRWPLHCPYSQQTACHFLTQVYALIISAAQNRFF